MRYFECGTSFERKHKYNAFVLHHLYFEIVIITENRKGVNEMIFSIKIS